MAVPVPVRLTSRAFSSCIPTPALSSEAGLDWASFLEVVFRAEMSIQRAEMCLCIDDMNRDLNVFRRVVGCTPHSSALITRHQHHQHRQRRRKRPDANTRKRTRTTKKKVKSVVPSQDGERSFFLETLKAWTKTTQKRKDKEEEEGKTKTFTRKTDTLNT